jgi:hypothetical protein
MITNSVSNIMLALYNSTPLQGTTYGSMFIFGAGSTDLIDTFSEIRLSDSIANIYAAMEADSLPIPSINHFSFQDIDLDVVDQNTLTSNWNLIYNNFTQDLYINLPYLHISTLLNGAEFMDLSFTRFSFKEGVISGGCLIHFPNDPVVNNLLVSRVSDILFHRVFPSTDMIEIKMLEFGSSKPGAIRFLSKVSIQILINPYAQQAGFYFDTKHPMELEDIQASLVQGGIDVIW